MAGPSNTIDLTKEPKDHLTALPSELQHEILDYLFPTHDPDAAAKANYVAPSNQPDTKRHHSFDALAATCHALRDGTFSWARLWLIRHQEITNYLPARPELQKKRDFLRGGPSGLLNWMDRHCVFCGKKSIRTAIMMNGLRCCRDCDGKHWPEKITKTDAKAQYDLKENQLLPNQHPAAKMLNRHPGGLPVLRYGTYMVSSVVTTMFMRSDVEALAKLAHGDLKAHFAKREAAREERKTKMAENRAKKVAQAIQLLQHERYAADGFVEVQRTSGTDCVAAYDTRRAHGESGSAHGTVSMWEVEGGYEETTALAERAARENMEEAMDASGPIPSDGSGFNELGPYSGMEALFAPL
ncbi:uncharacterized protein LTR77_009237 [Saxophila tyrrhenica]|uniref:F-box domain-containing protein n=1 Tax=Saxophila tyrrhenica TaxID=1690608 RepID=A0AAV9P1D8_9PEZI|nr:hypothetical protein LTR77_009237 [Saxophila tyrrhenica]